MWIFAEVPNFPGKGASNDSWVVENGNFQRFRWVFFVNFRDEAIVIRPIYRTQSAVDFTMIQNA